MLGVYDELAHDEHRGIRMGLVLILHRDIEPIFGMVPLPDGAIYDIVHQLMNIGEIGSFRHLSAAHRNPRQGQGGFLGHTSGHQLKAVCR